MEAVKALRPLSDPSKSLHFTGTTLSALRKELIGTEATLLGFVGTPWTLAAYAMEGKAEKDCKETKVDTNLLWGSLSYLKWSIYFPTW